MKQPKIEGLLQEVEMALQNIDTAGCSPDLAVCQTWAEVSGDCRCRSCNFVCNPSD